MHDAWRKAAIDGDILAIERLLAEGVDVDGLDHYAQTALMLAARHGHGDVVGLLLAAGADLDVTAKYRLSALMLAVINRHDVVARQLVDAGADVLLRSSGNTGLADQSARELAEQGGLFELAEYIGQAEKRGEPRVRPADPT